MLDSRDQLRNLYGNPAGRARDKVLERLEKHSIRFIELSPFVVISTFDSDGNVDTSPRGGEPGFVRVNGEDELVIPDSKGNNRVDSMQNIIDTGRIGTLFLVPGVDETLRVNGSARIANDDEVLGLFDGARQAPKTAIVIGIEEVFLHCAKALMRSKLWSAESINDRSVLPSTGRMLNDQIGIVGEAESQTDMVERYRKDL